jgi:hypothetical protein
MKRLAIGLGLVLVLVAVWSVRPPDVRSATNCNAQPDPGSGTAGDLLLAVTGPPDDAVAVGIHYIGGDGRTLVLERSGASWRSVRVPTARNRVLVQLQDATTDGATTWAVGSYRNDEPVAGYLVDGRWRWTQPIDPGPLEDEFLGVTTTPDGTVWAVGKHETADRAYQPLIERFDRGSWTVIDAPAIEGDSAVLKDVVAEPDGSIWAVGWTVGNDGKTDPLIERWDGTVWSDVAAPTDGLLSGVAIAPDGRPIAVGWRSHEQDTIVTLGLTADAWTAMPGDGDPGRLTAIVAGHGIVAVGLRRDDTGVPAPLAVDYSDGWQPIDTSTQPAVPGGAQLLGVTGAAGAFVAVGDQGSETGFGSLLVSGGCGA